MTLLPEFVRPGDLVFDVGANRGEFARACLELGARVVCVEPQPAAAEALRELPVVVVQAAVSDRHGIASLHVSGDDRYSSLLPEWIDAHRGYWGWAERASISVPQLTLDSLVRNHGMPDFLKVDTEGLEDRVLAGMTVKPDRLSFEYHGGRYPLDVALDVAGRCVAMLPDYRFRMAAESTRWATDWLGWEAAHEALQALDWGDVYAVRM